MTELFRDDASQEKIPRLISPPALSELMVRKRWKSFGAVCLEWMLLLIPMWLCSKTFNPLIYPLAVLWIGSRMHGLGILMHEATHYGLCKNRKLNDWLGEILLAWPLAITLIGYRKSHWAHHRHLNTAQDPDWVMDQGRMEYKFPKSRKQIVKDLFKYLVGYNTFKELGAVSYNEKIPWSITAARFSFYGLIVGSSIFFGFWKVLLLYWMVPLMSSFVFFLYLRGVAEHHALEKTNIFNSTRTVKPDRWETLLLAPWNVNYHLEHHLYPGVPFYNLGKLHKHLIENPVFQAQAHLTRGYTRGLLEDCTMSRKLSKVG